MTCLPRALALAQALSEHGYDANVRIGVRRSDAGVAAHAWVELDGRPMGEPEAIASEFLPLLPPTLESSSASSPPSGRRTSASGER